MNKRVSKSTFKAHTLALLREVERTGETLIITDRGKPVVELRPAAKAKRDPLAILKGSVLFYERPLDPVGEDDWEILNETK